MREIKFRAWWVAENKMLHNVHLFYDNLGNRDHGNEYEPERSFGDLLKLKEDYLVMQYTGLKDKNGKEIFEGDVVKYDHEYKGRTWVGEIIYNGYRFEGKDFYMGHHDDPSNLFGEGACFEIIGNIYENPELINNKT